MVSIAERKVLIVKEGFEIGVKKNSVRREKTVADYKRESEKSDGSVEGKKRWQNVSLKEGFEIKT